MEATVSSVQRHCPVEEKATENKKDEKKKLGFDKELVLKKMEKFLKSVESEKTEKRKVDISPYSERSGHKKRNSLNGNTGTKDSSSSSSSSRNMSSEKEKKYERKKRTRSRSFSRERKRDNSRERNNNSLTHHRRKRRRKRSHKKCTETKNSRYGKNQLEDQHGKYERYGRHSRYEDINRKEFPHRKRKNDVSDRRRNTSNSSYCSSSILESSEPWHKERRGALRNSQMNRRKKSENKRHWHDSKYGSDSKHIRNKYTGETVETKFFRIPLGYHTTKEHWESYTDWLKRKNKYRFDVPFDQHKIYRRSSSLSPGTWEQFVKDSDEDEAEESKSEVDTGKKEKHREQKKKRKRKRKEESEEEEYTSCSSKSSDLSYSRSEAKKKRKKHKSKKRKSKRRDKKKFSKEESKIRRKKERKRKDKKKDKEKIKERHKKKKKTKREPSESDKESISSSITSVSFLNEEWELEDKVFVKKEILKEDETKGDDRNDEDRDNIIKEGETKEEKMSSTQKEGNMMKETIEDEDEEISVKDDTHDLEESDNGSDIGPTPLDITVKLANKQINYGVAMMPGEGEAIAQFVQKGKRIPRRGEVGLSAEAIENYEKLGYVMSGSRHKRMNAIRMRKENQVYSAEEQRALAMYNYEERAVRENALINDLKEILRKQNEAIMNETQNEIE